MFHCILGQIKHTNRCVEVLRCLDVYVGVSIMTLDVLENLAMLSHPQCDDSGHYSRKHPVMPFSSRYSTPGFLTRDSLYLRRANSVARTFRILWTFAIVLEVCGISFFQYHEPLWQKFFEPKDHNQSALDEFSILYCDSANSTSPHVLSGRNLLNSFDILIHASTTQKIVCSFELSPLVVFWPSSINW